MADDFYVINELSTGTETITVTDDGTGNDWLVITGTYLARVDITLADTVAANGTPTAASGIYFDTSGGHRLVVNGQIENARGSDSVDFIVGNSLDNILYGDGAATGAGGGDLVDGGEGRDTIYGGAGNDVIGGGEDNDQLFGDAGNDFLYGGSGNDTLQGGEDNDQLFGDAGNDFLYGGSGNDTLQGGLGRDTLSGGADRGDVVSYAESNAGVIIQIEFGETTTGRGGHAQGDTINGLQNVIGSNHDDTIRDMVDGDVAFGGNSNTFFGRGGDDTLFMGGGKDQAFGGDGDDNIDGGAGSDRLLGENGNDIITGGTGNDSLIGGDGNDRLSGGKNNDRIDGGNNNDLVRGEDGADVLNGGAGNDRIIGGGGRDLMSGGGGDDIFVFTATSDSTPRLADVIRDFGLRGDEIDLDAIDANTLRRGNQDFEFAGAQAIGTTAGQVHVVDTARGVQLWLNTDNDRQAEAIITLEGRSFVREVWLDL